MKISPKIPAEVIPVTFDFSTIPLTSFDSVVETGITVVTGTDGASANMIYGAPIATGTNVVQLIRNGVAGVTYNLFCIVAKSDERYQLDANMECKARHS